MKKNIVVTTGIYDLIKEQIRRKKVSRPEADILNEQLKNAQQVLRKDLPQDVVTVNRKVTIKDHTLNTEEVYTFVDSNKQRLSKRKFAIGSKMGLITVGCSVGDQFSWPFETGERKIEILNVETV
jgi:regulator of nucleoside diphosphate kinase